jgi:hypothetical protein
MTIIPIQSLNDNAAEARRAVAEADVVIGVDMASRRAFTVFGTPSLEESIQFGKEGALRTVQIGFNKEIGEFEQLVALVRAIKGRHDSLAGDE